LWNDEHLSGVKTASFFHLFGPAKEAAEELRDLSGREQNHPSAAEAGPFPMG